MSFMWWRNHRKNNSYGCSKAAWKNEGDKDNPKWKNDGCNYSIFKGALQKMGGEEITSEQVKNLLENGSFKTTLTSTKDVEVDEKFGVKIKWK